MINDNNLLNNDNKEVKKRTDAQKKATAKYNNAHYKTITAQVKNADKSLFLDYAQQNNMSISKLIYNCIKYCMQNNIKFDN